MNSVKASFLAISIIFASPWISFSAENLSIITDEWPPYVYVENEKMKGFDYEVMMAVLADMKYHVNFKIHPWKRCLLMIKNQQADAVLDIGITEDRKTHMIFPEESISSSASVLFCLKTASFSFERLEDLKGLKIGTLRGYFYSEEINKSSLFEKIPVETVQQNIVMLELGRIDTFIANRNAGLFIADEMGVSDKIRYLKKEISGGPLYLAFSKKQSNFRIAAEFSKQLKIFKRTEKYKNILKKYGQSN